MSEGLDLRPEASHQSASMSAGGMNRNQIAALVKSHHLIDLFKPYPFITVQPPAPLHTWPKHMVRLGIIFTRYINKPRQCYSNILHCRIRNTDGRENSDEQPRPVQRALASPLTKMKPSARFLFFFLHKEGILRAEMRVQTWYASSAETLSR